MANPFKIHMKIEAEKKHSIKYTAVSSAAPMQSVYINKKELPAHTPEDIMITVDFVDWDYILGHMTNNNDNHKNRKNK